MLLTATVEHVHSGCVFACDAGPSQSIRASRPQLSVSSHDKSVNHVRYFGRSVSFSTTGLVWRQDWHDVVQELPKISKETVNVSRPSLLHITVSAQGSLTSKLFIS